MKTDLCHLTLEKPPEILFKAVNGEDSLSQYESGLKRQKSPFIELFANERDARTEVKGFADVFVIMAHLMEEDGYVFYHAETGEWLTDEVPTKYIRLQ